MRRTKGTQTRPARDKKADSRPDTGTAGGKKRPPKKTKVKTQEEAEMGCMPVDATYSK